MTPTPWSLHISKDAGIETETLTGAAKYDGDYFAIVGADGEVVCDNADYYAQPVKPENMKPIVKCVNCHDDLLAALQGVQTMANCGQLDEFLGEPWLKAVTAAIAKATA